MVVEPCILAVLVFDTFDSACTGGILGLSTTLDAACTSSSSGPNTLDTACASSILGLNTLDTGCTFYKCFGVECSRHCLYFKYFGLRYSGILLRILGRILGFDSLEYCCT